MKINNYNSNLNYLQRGHVVTLFGSEHVVTESNDCRARCVPLAAKQVDYTTTGGKRVAFSTHGTAHSISPNSEIPILRRLSENELDDLNIKSAKIITV